MIQHNVIQMQSVCCQRKMLPLHETRKKCKMPFSKIRGHEQTKHHNLGSQEAQCNE